MTPLLKVSDAIDAGLARIGAWVNWLFVVITVVIVFDVLSRKFHFQIPAFGSTKLQELEWHLHGTLFVLWLGYGYVRGAHVRIDVVSGALRERTRDWIEWLGCLFFAIPYGAVVLFYAWTFFSQSFAQNERSSAPNGLSDRWVLKLILVAGLVLLLAGVTSVLLRKTVALFGADSRAPGGFKEIEVGGGDGR